MKEKGRTKRHSEAKELKEEKRKKTMIALSSFNNSYFGVSFWPKTTVGGKRVHLAVTI